MFASGGVQRRITTALYTAIPRPSAQARAATGGVEQRRKSRIASGLSRASRLRRAPSRHSASWYGLVSWSPLYSWPNSWSRRRSTSSVAPCSNHLWPSRSKLRSSRPDPTTRHKRSSRTWRAAPTESARQLGCNRMGERTDKCRQAERGGQELRRPAPTRQPLPNEEHHEEPAVPRHLENDHPPAAPAGSPVPGWLPLLTLTGACRGLRRSTDTRGLATGCRAFLFAPLTPVPPRITLPRPLRIVTEGRCTAKTRPARRPARPGGRRASRCPGHG
jgi:hypothetical protein